MARRETLRMGKTQTTFTFNRAAVVDHYTAGAIAAGTEVSEMGAERASGYSPVLTGALRDSMEAREARIVRGQMQFQFGSYGGLAYAPIQERKHHMIQRAADEVLPLYPVLLLKHTGRPPKV